MTFLTNVELVGDGLLLQQDCCADDLSDGPSSPFFDLDALSKSGDFSSASTVKAIFVVTDVRFANVSGHLRHRAFAG